MGVFWLLVLNQSLFIHSTILFALHFAVVSLFSKQISWISFTSKFIMKFKIRVRDCIFFWYHLSYHSIYPLLFILRKITQTIVSLERTRKRTRKVSRKRKTKHISLSARLLYEFACEEERRKKKHLVICYWNIRYSYTASRMFIVYTTKYLRRIFFWRAMECLLS